MYMHWYTLVKRGLKVLNSSVIVALHMCKTKMQQQKKNKTKFMGLNEVDAIDNDND